MLLTCQPLQTMLELIFIQRGFYKMQKTIHKQCKEFRENVLKITLKEMQDKTGVKLGTISAFENGNSNNLNHMHLYANCCESEHEINEFHNLINSCLIRGFK